MELPPALLQIISAASALLFWLACGSWLIYAYFVLFHGGVPNIRTAPAIRQRLIELLKADCGARGIDNYTIMDIGSGNGLLTRELARALPQAKIIGIEINRLSVIWSNWMKRRWQLPNLEYRRENFLKSDFKMPDAPDAFVMFLIPAVLGLLGRKLHEEAKAGAFIVSNKFPLGDGWQPVDVIQTSTLYLHQGKTYLYRKD